MEVRKEGRGAVCSYKELVAWKKAMELAEAVYSATRTWPKDEIYGLTNQIRRAAVSIPSNIAKGQGRFSTKEFMHFLSIAHGSLLEVETQALLAQRLGYLSSTTAESLLINIAEVGRLLNGLYRSLSEK